MSLFPSHRQTGGVTAIDSAIRLHLLEMTPGAGDHQFFRRCYSMEISARNQLQGTVTSTRLGTIMAEIVVDIQPGTVVAAITDSSAERLDLKAGDKVKVIVKATDVMIAKV